ncbi:MAG: hypothetical protein NTV93_01320 [Verrucomicrobia bacterium]|nr:hypothetical protein [Verrucomicrobiota bacterium]
MSNHDINPGPGRKIPSWIFSVPPLFVFLLWWAALFPGMMNADSIYMWGEVVSGSFDEMHTAFVPILYSVLAKVWGTPAVVGLAQILFLVLVLNYLFRVLKSMGAPDGALALISLYFCVSPMIGATLVTLEKDIPFGVLMLLLSAYGIRIVESGGRWLGSTRNLACLSASLALLSLCRHEGIIPAVAFVIALLVFYFPEWRRITAVLASGALCALIVRGPIYECYHVNRDIYRQVAIKEWCDLAVARANGGTFSDAERAVFSSMMPEEANKPAFDNYRPFASMMSAKVNLPELYEGHREIHSIWRRSLRNNWPVLLGNLPKSGSLVWQIFEPPGCWTYTVHLVPVPQGIDDSSLGLHLAHPLPLVEGILRRLLEITDARFWKSVLYRPALYLYASVFSVLTACILERKPALSLLVLPLLAHAMFLFLYISDQHSRYLFYAFLMAPGLVAYSLIKVRSPGAGTPALTGAGRFCRSASGWNGSS